MPVRIVRAVLVAALALAGGNALSSGPQFFYCYAPEPSTGTVYMSQVLPVGPVSERAGYGRGFSSYLKSQGTVHGDVQAYCVMRATADEVSRNRDALATEACPECAGATRFDSVHWPRGGEAAVMEATVIKAAVVAPLQDTPPQKPKPKRDIASGPTLVVMGNSETGKLLVFSNRPDLQVAADAQARSIRPTGWQMLLATSEPGFGAAFCVRHDDVVRFFVAHAQLSIKQAIAGARELSAGYAADTGQEQKICGAPWQARPGIDTPRDQEVIDVLKDAVRKQVTCDREAKPDDPDARPCPPPSRGAAGARG